MATEHAKEWAVHGVSIADQHLVVRTGVMVLHFKGMEPQSHLVFLKEMQFSQLFLYLVNVFLIFTSILFCDPIQSNPVGQEY